MLFCSRIGSALVFAVPVDAGPWAQIETMSINARKFISESAEGFKTGKILDQFQLKAKVWTSSFLCWSFRLWSIYLHGKAARRRTALLALLRFMFNLALLGALAVLFWALAIKLVLVPAQVPLSQALLASASHAIPGVPDTSVLKIPAFIQTLDALTAWLVFVLYAGPVASLFPAFQEQAIRTSAANYSRLRSERVALCRLHERLAALQVLVRQHPEIAKIGKAAIELRSCSMEDVRQSLLDQPELLQTLASAPFLANYMKTLGAPLPNLEELVKEIPTAIDNTALISSGVSVHDPLQKNDEGGTQLETGFPEK
jgi:ABC-type multidrug transport system fused ATPase/permease subunit